MLPAPETGNAHPHESRPAQKREWKPRIARIDAVPQALGEIPILTQGWFNGEPNRTCKFLHPRQSAVHPIARSSISLPNSAHVSDGLVGRTRRGALRPLDADAPRRIEPARWQRRMPPGLAKIASVVPAWADSGAERPLPEGGIVMFRQGDKDVTRMARRCAQGVLGFGSARFAVRAMNCRRAFPVA